MRLLRCSSVFFVDQDDFSRDARTFDYRLTADLVRIRFNEIATRPVYVQHRFIVTTPLDLVNPAALQSMCTAKAPGEKSRG